MALLRPEYYMPIHGEARHLYAGKEIGEFMGIPPSNIFLSDIGKVLEIDTKGARFSGTVPAGKVLIDGIEVGYGAGESKKEAEQRAAFSVSQGFNDADCTKLLDKLDNIDAHSTPKKSDKTVEKIASKENKSKTESRPAKAPEKDKNPDKAVAKAFGKKKNN